MTAGELIKLIPQKTFQDLAIETKVDTQVKKLSGEVIFKLILFSMLNSDKLSLRVMETFLQSARFKSFTSYDILEGKYNSIRDRICTINAEYFEKFFEIIFSIYNKELKEEKALSKTDSTYVALAAKLFSSGMMNGDNNKRFVKYTVNLKGSIPSSVKVFTDQSYVSEELALAELINETSCIEGNVVVFDRGLQSRNSFDKFTESNKLFVSRANLNIRCKTASCKKVNSKPADSSVTILSDEIGFLINKKQKHTQHQYRIIKGFIDESQEAICFVTNILDEDPFVIAGWYKQRWEIETFFKFIKQHLNVKHLVSRDENGIKVMIYMTMILAILIIAYKKLNNIKGFKIAKLKFEIELENDMIKTIVMLCGGDPNKAAHLFRSG
ncbi:hypothetical protein BH10BAC2_BH10BAC2_01570 [soil metagenome]